MAEPGSPANLAQDPGLGVELASALPPAARTPPPASRWRRRGRRAGRKESRVSRLRLPLLTVVGLLAILELLTANRVLGPYFPTVVQIGRELVRQVETTLFWDQVGNTVVASIVGFAIAAAIAVPLGFLIAANRFVFRSTRLIIDFLRPIPPVAVLPLAVLVVGTGTEMKIWLVAFSALWPILFQTVYGARDVDPVASDTSRAYGLNRLQQYWHVVLPSATPYVATGLRLAATISLVVAIATELIVGSVGLGYEINQVRYANNTAAMYALIFVAGLLGWFITAGFGAAEKRVLHWHHSHREKNS